jgi:glycosyltransferase involved in cell wall biosynthesis
MENSKEFKKPKLRLCLNMIVRSEGHIIEETLNSVLKYISYWVISDTGSTDNTKEIVKEFFKKHNVPGKLVEHKWEDFGTNRTLALQACWKVRKHFDYIWVFDADDLVDGNLIFPESKEPDMYSLKYGSGFTYNRNQVFKATEKFQYLGVLHEYPKCKSKKKPVLVPIEGDYYIDSRRLGARNKAEDKYERDAQTLLKGLKKEPRNERYMFYLAQSYMDAKDFKNAIKWYNKRIKMKGWYEEVYYSYYRIATCMENDGQDWKEVEKAYLRAWTNLQSRAEPLYEIAKYYRKANNFVKGYAFAKQACSIPFPSKQVLFLFKNVYDHKAPEELMICAHFMKKYEESFNIGNKLLKTNLPEKDRKDIEKTRDLNIEHILDNYISYPVNKILEIRKSVDTKNIIFTITTCKRFDLFHKTINSFVHCCEDVLKIDKWLCVDDNSSEEDREKMKKLYPFFEFVWKTPEEKGHVESMQIIWNKIQDYKYVCHMEDDWHFFEKRDYLTEATRILEHDDDLGQLLFNVNYAQRPRCRNIAGGFVKYCQELRYVEHEHYPPGKEYDDFIERNKYSSTQAYWPGYSLRPSVLNVNALREVGNFENETGHFEMDYAKRYYKAGYRSAFLDTVCSYHTGKLTWEKNEEKPNAYDLNNVTQFHDAPNIKPEVKKIEIVEEDEWLVVKDYDSFGNDIQHLKTEEVEILKMVALADDNCVGFNNLGYLKHVIAPSTLWLDVSSNFPNFKMYVHKERYEKYLKEQNLILKS